MIAKRPEWGNPSDKIGPDAPSLQIWRLRLTDLGGNPVALLRPLTTRSERRRAARYRFEADQHRHLAGRALVRTFLAHRHDCAPQAPSITKGPHGKPMLNDSRLRFNIAHTSNVVVAAFSRGRRVGIDVEAVDRDADEETLTERVFTAAERRRWRDLPPAQRSAFFFQVWTCKEAFLKATGQGFQRAARTVECTFDGQRVVGLTNKKESTDTHSSPHSPATEWRLRPFTASTGVIGAVARAQSLPSSLCCADATRHLSRFSRSRRTET